MSPKGSGRSLLRRLGALALGLAVGLGVAELAVRLLDPEARYEPTTIRTSDGEEIPMSSVLPYMRRQWSERESGSRRFECWFCYDRPRWDYFDDDGCVHVAANSIGLRDEEIGPKAPDELRALAIGDSFTFGFGVRLEDSWPQVLERLLAGDRAGPVQVVNGGFAGGSAMPEGYARWLEEEGLALDPDWVLFGLCLNDVDEKVPMAVLPSRGKGRWLGGVSHLLNKVQGELERRRDAERLASVPAAAIEAQARRYLDGDDWPRAQAALRATKARLDERGIRFSVVVFPMLTQLTGRYPFEPLHAAVARFCRAKGIEHVDLLEPVRAWARSVPGFEDRDAWVHPHDQHPSPEVLRLMTEHVYAQLGPGG